MLYNALVEVYSNSELYYSDGQIAIMVAKNIVEFSFKKEEGFKKKKKKGEGCFFLTT